MKSKKIIIGILVLLLIFSILGCENLDIQKNNQTEEISFFVLDEVDENIENDEREVVIELTNKNDHTAEIITLNINQQGEINLPSNNYQLRTNLKDSEKNTWINRIDLDRDLINKKGILLGLVIDTLTRKPVSEAKVIAVTDGIKYETKTDEYGFYRLNLPAMTYQVTVEKEGYLAVSKDVIVRSNMISLTNFRIKPEDKIFGSLKGRVIDSLTQEPIAGVVVRYIGEVDYPIRNSNKDDDDNSKRVVNTRVTDEKGFFEFAQMVPAKYTIEFMKRGYINISENVHIIAGETSYMTVFLDAVSKFGYVYGKVSDEKDKGLADVTLSFYKIDTNLGLKEQELKNRRPEFEVVTDSNGYYKAELLANRYLVVLKKEGYQVFRDSFSLNPLEKLELNYQLSPFIKPPEKVRVFGQVTEARTNYPIGRAKITFIPMRIIEPPIIIKPPVERELEEDESEDINVKWERKRDDRDIRKVVYTDKDGNYKISLEKGSYFVIVEAKDYFTQKTKLDINSNINEYNFTLRIKYSILENQKN